MIERERERERERDRKAEAEDSSLRGHTVLCVDDEPHILSSLRRLMRNESYNLVTTSNPLEALEYVGKYGVSLAIIDQRMPEVTGSELAKEIRGRSSNTMVVILTGYPDDVPIVRSIMSDHVHQLIFKPWNDKKLKNTIVELLHQQESM